MVAGGRKEHTDVALGGFHPLAQVFDVVGDALHAGHDFGDEGFVFGAAAKILVNGAG